MSHRECKHTNEKRSNAAKQSKQSNSANVRPQQPRTWSSSFRNSHIPAFSLSHVSHLHQFLHQFAPIRINSHLQFHISIARVRAPIPTSACTSPTYGFSPIRTFTPPRSSPRSFSSTGSLCIGPRLVSVSLLVLTGE